MNGMDTFHTFSLLIENMELFFNDSCYVPDDVVSVNFHYVLISTASLQPHKGLDNKTMEQEKLMRVGKGDHLTPGGRAVKSVAHIAMEVMG